MDNTARFRRRSVILTVLMALSLAWAMMPGVASAHPDPLDPQHKGGSKQVADHPLAYGDGHLPGGLEVHINSPTQFAAQLPAVKWDDAGAIADQTADFVYGGSGCTVASYAAVADKVRGKIALIDDTQSVTNPADRCPTYAFMQKVRAAQSVGAIGLVQIPREGFNPDGGWAVSADIPAVEVWRTDAVLAMRDAVAAGEAVNATMTDTRQVEAMSNVPCEGGFAGPFECDGVDLLSYVPSEEFDGGDVSDIWGWTDPDSGDEYVFFGKTNGTAFFRVTDPTNPVYLGELPNPAAAPLVWHDMKVYDNHVFIVSESEPHGMLVFDLTRLRGVTEAQTWDEDAWYPLNVAAHNIAINEDTGFAYIVGGNAGLVAPDQCLSGLHMVNIQNPKNPTFAGCYAVDGGPGTAARTAGLDQGAAYIHDTQCVIYEGPDTRYTGRELCFNASENKVVIADVTNKALPVTVGMTDYSDVSYAHQGWLTEDQAFFIANDELDEQAVNERNAEEHDDPNTEPPKANTRTIVFDMRDLENPKVHFEHFHDTTSIDHNNYVHEGRVYQSNYTSGLQVMDAANINDATNPRLERLAFFDVYPWGDEATFDGTWSNYPYFESGTIAVSGIGEGLFLLRLQGGDEVDKPGNGKGNGPPDGKGPPEGKGPKNDR